MVAVMFIWGLYKRRYTSHLFRVSFDHLRCKLRHTSVCGWPWFLWLTCWLKSSAWTQDAAFDYWNNRITALLTWTGHWHLNHQCRQNMLLPWYSAFAIGDKLTFITFTDWKFWSIWKAFSKSGRVFIGFTSNLCVLVPQIRFSIRLNKAVIKIKVKVL